MDVFYREAGPADAPVLLLLHGFPTSSHMFRNLIPLLADRYRVIALDYPGYSHGDAPDGWHRAGELLCRHARHRDAGGGSGLAFGISQRSLVLFARSAAFQMRHEQHKRDEFF